MGKIAKYVRAQALVSNLQATMDFNTRRGLGNEVADSVWVGKIQSELRGHFHSYKADSAKLITRVMRLSECREMKDIKCTETGKIMGASQQMDKWGQRTFDGLKTRAEASKVKIALM